MLAKRVRGAGLDVVASYMIQKHCSGGRPLSFGARPCCDVPAAASNTQQTFSWRTRERATALAVSPDEAEHARLRCARAVPRWLYSLCTRRKGTAPARGLSPSAQDRGATCQLQLPPHRRLSRGAHANAPLRSPSLETRRSTHTCDARALRRAGCIRFTRDSRALHQREASLLRRKTVLQCASCGLQHTADF